MNCEQAEASMGDLICGRLPAERAARVSDHIAICEPCAAHHRKVRTLYLVEPPDDLILPERWRAPIQAAGLPRQLKTYGVRVAAAALLILVGYNLAPIARERAAEQGARASRDSLLPIRLQMPDLPTLSSTDRWGQSRDEALLLARYSGKPLLEHVNAPLGGAMGGLSPADRKQLSTVLDRFVYCQSMSESDGRDACVLKIDDGQCDVRVIPIGRGDQLEGVLASLPACCDGKPPLSNQLLEQSLLRVRSVPNLLAGGLYREALDQLRKVVQLEQAYRTCFPEVARMLSTQITEGLERNAEQIEALYQGDAEERVQAIRWARSLVEQVEGLEIGKRLRRCSQ